MFRNAQQPANDGGASNKEHMRIPTKPFEMIELFDYNFFGA